VDTKRAYLCTIFIGPETKKITNPQKFFVKITLTPLCCRFQRYKRGEVFKKDIASGAFFLYNMLYDYSAAPPGPPARDNRGETAHGYFTKLHQGRGL
jgi:hypothetical protein